MFAQLREAQLAADWHEDAWAKGFLGGTPYRDQLDKWAIDYMGGGDVRDSSLVGAREAQLLSIARNSLTRTKWVAGVPVRGDVRICVLRLWSRASLAFSLAPVSSFAMPLLLSRPRPLLCAR